MGLSLRRAGAFLVAPGTRYVLAWGLAVGAALTLGRLAWGNFADAGRRDGNFGHTLIDFGGQWVLGRALVCGHGRRLYVRSQLRSVLRESLPPEDQNPEFGPGPLDVEWLMLAMMGRDVVAEGPAPSPEAEVGGPLYPPVGALLLSPLGLLPPQRAYRLYQLANLLLAFACGLALRQLSRGRVWWPVASLFVLAFPGYYGALALGQNSVLSLAVLLWGWWLGARGRPVAGGCLWGLLAFKPVWALAFLGVLLLTRRWRMALAMAATAALLALATVPLVGWQGWRHWLQVGREAAVVYNFDSAWIFLSRDLLSVPRRWLFTRGAAGAPGTALQVVAAVGWALVLLVFEWTAWLALTRKAQARRAVAGPAAAFLLLGGWLTCLHFMYYDVLLAALPVFLVLADPRLSPRARCAGGRPGARPRGRCRRARLLASPGLYLALSVLVAGNFSLLLGRGPSPVPWETFSLFALWLWCGWRWSRWARRAGAGRGAAPAPAPEAAGGPAALYPGPAVVVPDGA